MFMLATVQSFVVRVRDLEALTELDAAMQEIASLIGASYYAITQHLAPGRSDIEPLRLIRYPDAWVHYFDEHALSVSDPMHRASQRAITGFRWSEIAAMINLTSRDRQILSDAREHGLGDGFTIPAHLPGEASGSCSFAAAAGTDLDEAMLPLAQLAGQFGYEAARRIVQRRAPPAAPALTERQIECIMWVARGKTDWEIASILGVSRATVGEHLRHARERYDAPTRAMLPVRALYDGALSFADVMGQRYPSNM